MKHRLVITCSMPEGINEHISKNFDALFVHRSLSDYHQLITLLEKHKAEGVLTGGNIELSKQAIDKFPSSVKVISTYSAGYDNIDTVAARARGIIVTNVPSGSTECIADFTMMLLLCATRRAREYHELMQSGWGRVLGFGEMLGVRVSGKTLGILGMGKIGQELAQRARGFNMKIIYHNRNRLPPEQELGAKFFKNLNEMLPHCDFLSLNAPGGTGSDHIINRKSLALLPERAILVNTARGKLIDEDALLEALESGRLAAAGLDVFESEPDYNQRFKGLSNLFLTPHVASATVESRSFMVSRALDNISAILSGKPPLNPV